MIKKLNTVVLTKKTTIVIIAPMDTKTTVFEILKSGMTQVELASAVGCAQSTISSLLNGIRGARISKALGDRLEEIHRQRCQQKEVG